MIKDAAIQGSGYFAGANRPDAHLIGVEPGRDFEFEELDIRPVEAGDLSPSGDPIEIETAIEVGNIFKLGTRYSEPLGATYLDAEGTRAADRDGQLRDRAGADHRRRDRAGRRREGDRLAARAGALGGPPGRPRQGRRGDDRRRRPPVRGARARPAWRRSTTTARRAPGEKLTDAELLGCPLRIVVGKRALAEGEVEAQERARRRGSPAARSRTPRGARSRSSARRAEGAPACPTKRRLFGIDRSGPAAEADAPRRAAAPVDDPEPGRLHPPRRDPGLPRARVRLGRRPRHRAGPDLPRRSPAATTSTASSPARRASTRGWARCSTRSSTGSRCSPAPPSAGTSSCCRAGRWRCSPCARWSRWCWPQVALRRGIDIEVNWIGRIGVFLVFGGIFWSMVVDWWIIEAGFVVGVAFALVGDGRLRASRPRARSTHPAQA